MLYGSDSEGHLLAESRGQPPRIEVKARQRHMHIGLRNIQLHGCSQMAESDPCTQGSTLRSRNFCLKMRPFPFGKGFKELANKVSGTNIIAGAQVTVILFATLEGRIGVILFIASQSTAAIIGILTRTPGTDMRDMDPAAVRLMRDVILNCVFLPEMKFLALAAVFLTLEVKVLKYNRMH